MEKPYKVILALRMLWTLWAFEFFKFSAAIFFALTFKGAISKDLLLQSAIIYLVIIIILGLVNYYTSKGKHLARLIYVIYVLVNTGYTLSSLIVSHHIHNSFLLPMCLFGLQALIVWLLFHSESSSWFQPEKSEE